jgi:hypothetical protein
MERLAALPSRVPEGAFKPYQPPKPIRYVTNNTEDRQGAVVEGPNGELYVVQGEQLARLSDLVKYQVKDAAETARREDQIRRLIGLRKAYGRLIGAERAGEAQSDTPEVSKGGTDEYRQALRGLYDAFVAEHGRINSSDGLRYLKKVEDPFFASLAALEHEGQPARVLFEPTVRTKKRLAQPSVRDALVLARNESLHIDLARIAELSGKTEAEVASELTEAGALFRTPAGVYEVADVYLSGNVRRKLREAEDAQAAGASIPQQDMTRNIEALKRVLPKTVPYFQIEAKLGAPWVQAEHYRQAASRGVLGLGVTRSGAAPLVGAELQRGDECDRLAPLRRVLPHLRGHGAAPGGERVRSAQAPGGCHLARARQRARALRP